jgi:exosortase
MLNPREPIQLGAPQSTLIIPSLEEQRRRLPSGERWRLGCFGALVCLSFAVFWPALSTLIRFSLQHEHYSHLVLVPLISMALVLLERRRIFSRVETDWSIGASLMCGGVLLYAVAQRNAFSMSQNDQLSAATFALVVVWIGALALCYGTRSVKRGLFPVMFLFLMVPIPDVLLEKTVAYLVMGSAEVSYVLLELLSVPFLRDGFVFSFPGFAIEIAQECSGIRSSLALLLLSLLTGYLVLRSAWARALLVFATIPILIVKNGIRIVTLTLLSMHVDQRFLTGSLHQQGGFVFFLIALMLLAPVLWLLQKLEVGPRIATASASRD